MTDITKYRNVSLTKETYKTLEKFVEGIIARRKTINNKNNRINCK